ncbi:TPA: hypothetical protein SCO74_001810 [Campylobacter jejuni]|jgi:hypothetical protein|uniref:hypothetical protein n=1 Tax=Clostridium tertium TaxID=1559 RepID=UPI0022493E13|nr:hypothetical protein [Brucella intermedia]HEG1432434.1 hypothetical protein [Campylobacter jejuni]
MNKKIISKIISSCIAIGIISTLAVPVSAAKINKKSLEQVKEEFNLESLDSIDQVPDNAKILKFDTVEQAEAFLKVLVENDKEGNVLDVTSLDVTSLESNARSSSKIIDLSDQIVSDKNFLSENLDKTESVIDENKIEPMTYYTTREGTYYYSINGIAKMTGYCTMQIEWDSSLGNYIYGIDRIVASFSGITFGNSWSQFSYDYNIRSDKKSVTGNVYGHYDYYLLIDTSLTSIAGKDRSYYFEFIY